MEKNTDYDGNINIVISHKTCAWYCDALFVPGVIFLPWLNESWTGFGGCNCSSMSLLWLWCKYTAIEGSLNRTILSPEPAVGLTITTFSDMSWQLDYLDILFFDPLIWFIWSVLLFKYSLCTKWKIKCFVFNTKKFCTLLYNLIINLAVVK